MTIRASRNSPVAGTYLKRAGLVFAGALAALSLSEGLVRVFYPYSRDHVVPSGLFAMDDQLGWRLTANTSVDHHSRYFDATYRTNSLGYRDQARDPSPPSRIRMLLYGDSQIFGWGVPAESRFTDRIEAQTMDREVWNLAVPGYGLDQEVLSYAVYGQRLHADEVVFYVSDSTLERTRFDYIYRKHKPRFMLDDEAFTLIPVAGGATTWSNILYRMLSPLYLPYFVERRLALLGTSPASTSASTDDSAEDDSATRELATRILERAQAIARERGQEITVLADLSEAAMASWKQHCGEKGISFLEVHLPETASLRFGSDDRHWTPAAHQLIAEQLIAQLAARDRSAAYAPPHGAQPSGRSPN